MKDNLKADGSSKQISDLMPFCFYTDGGTFNLDFTYFIQNIFKQTTICYSTKVPGNAHVQAYLGQAIN